MKSQLSRIIIPVLILFVLCVVGCDKTPTGTGSAGTVDTAASATATQQAYSEMETQFYNAATLSGGVSNAFNKVSFTKANTLYRQAVGANPNNAEANLGSAITEIFGIYADTSVQGIVNRWQSSGQASSTARTMLQFGIPTGTKDMAVPAALLGQNLVKILKTAQSNPPTISEMQNVLRNAVLPHITYALARLAVVEQNPTFTMKISGKMQGNPNLSAVTLDLTEVYLMDAMLQWMNSTVEEFLIFQFTLPSYSTSAIVDAVRQTNTTFFVLASDGKTHATNSKNALLATTARIRSAITFLEAATGDQSNHIIKISRNGQGGIQQSDLDAAIADLTKAENYLNSTVSIDLNNWGTQKKNYTVQVSLGQFFANPPQNPKANWFPAYTVDTTSHGDILFNWTAQTYADFTFPDPTFGGIFPGMTNDELKQLLYIDQSFAWTLSCYLYTNGDSVKYTSVSMKIVVNGKTYLSNPPNYISTYGQYGFNGSMDFMILDNDGGAADLYAVINGVDVLLESSKRVYVRLKNTDYLNADLSLASQHITAAAVKSPALVKLSLYLYDSYMIERADAGSFSVIDSTGMLTTSAYMDYNVTSGQTYHYRVRVYPSASNYYYYYSYYATRAGNYSNTVSVTVP